MHFLFERVHFETFPPIVHNKKKLTIKGGYKNISKVGICLIITRRFQNAFKVSERVRRKTLTAIFNPI